VGKGNGGGYLHKVADNGVRRDAKVQKRYSNDCVNWKSLCDLYQHKITPCGKIHLDNKLGLQQDTTLWQFNIGWDGEAYTFPAFDGYGNMNGIQRRWPNGTKMWVARSRNGIFIPKLRSVQGNVFVTEGVSDAAALVDCRYRAIARASCSCGQTYIKEFIGNHKKIEQITVVADNDTVGRNGAIELAHALCGSGPRIAVLEVPMKYKDVRQWYVTEGLNNQKLAKHTRRLM
jgi:hypothetical protein